MGRKMRLSDLQVILKKGRDGARRGAIIWALCPCEMPLYKGVSRRKGHEGHDNFIFSIMVGCNAVSAV